MFDQLFETENDNSMKKIKDSDKKAVRIALYESAAYGPAGAFFDSS